MALVNDLREQLKEIDGAINRKTAEVHEAQRALNNLTESRSRVTKKLQHPDLDLFRNNMLLCDKLFGGCGERSPLHAWGWMHALVFESCKITCPKCGFSTRLNFCRQPMGSVTRHPLLGYLARIIETIGIPEDLLFDNFTSWLAP